MADIILLTLARLIDPALLAISVIGSLVPRTMTGAALCGFGSGVLYWGVLGALNDSGGVSPGADFASAILGAEIVTMTAAAARLKARGRSSQRRDGA